VGDATGPQPVLRHPAGHLDRRRRRSPLENKHFDPDYEIDNDPRLEAGGRDQQLEQAVEVLLGDL